ncbi:PSD1 and planctomycete cytochrome C domain-containing protein [Stieleria varia]|uniref:Planctomycete cytochrome C n=1 Tax=Stieleria varia TaxID=2528005 RepID=A0A5C6BB60_9BACT|nr:PSD1 and planctomycete cytochrome C domain-containing protein [Stieleria varia]TWU08509.1 Planctomycete cytochrome C [Stieleria varia]
MSHHRCFLACVMTLVFAMAFVSQRGVIAEDSSEYFESHVRPLLIAKCVECHGGMTPEGDLNLATRDGFIKGGTSGGLTDGVDPEWSLLFERIITPDEDAMMPPDERLTSDEVAVFKKWIEAGSVWPESSLLLKDGIESGSQHWSFQSLQRPRVPQLDGDTWCWTPIDRFILAKMSETGVSPVTDADNATWLRRVTLAATGLPPSLSQIDAMQSAERQDAVRTFERREINRLLASRGFAERQARRWLDVARYADTSGDGTDTPIPEARYYRDWVIDAFDTDKPYDEFVIEQIAGDLLAAQNPESPEAFRQTIATGFIALSRRFGNSKFASMHQIIDDTIDTVGKSTMGLSLGCARCHHHKFDPVTTQDYYGLYGYFDNTQYPHAGTEHQKERSDMPPISVPMSWSDRYESSVAWAVSDKPNPQDSRIHIAGDPAQKGDVAPRAFLGFLSGDDVEIPDDTSGRLQLARRIASADNPLFARVMVNRIWQGYFGQGLVENASNFGVQTAQPLHHELLDYLACELIDSGWSIKHVHRLVLTSHVFRLSSQTTESGLARDQANRCWWHFPRVRMDAETLRDSILAASGQLELGDGGRHPFKPTEKLQYNQGRPFNEIFDHSRRSVYLMTPRLNKHPMMAMFDGADANVTTASRGESTVPLQSLFAMNSPFMASQASSLAIRVLESADTTPARIGLLWRLTLGRLPDESEQNWLAQYVESTISELAAEGRPSDDASTSAWTSVARTMLASNEFIYID